MCNIKTLRSKTFEIIMSTGLGNYNLTQDQQIQSVNIVGIQFHSSTDVIKSPINGTDVATDGCCRASYVTLKVGVGGSDEKLYQIPTAKLLTLTPASFPQPILDIEPSNQPLRVDFSTSTIRFPQTGSVENGKALVFTVYFYNQGETNY